MSKSSTGPALAMFAHPRKTELESWLTIDQRLRTVEEALHLIHKRMVTSASKKRKENVEVEADIQRLSMYCFATVTYMRCFNTGKKLRINVEDVPRVSPKDLAFHESLRELRNHHFAHAVADHEGVDVYLEAPGSNERPEGFALVYVVLSSADRGDVRRFYSLVRKVRRYVQARASVVGDEIAVSLFGKGSRWSKLCGIHLGAALNA